VDIEVRMDSESILANTMLLFGAMILLVAVTFAAFIWFIRSRGAAEPSPGA
jgi:heme/copper-type cytochrome/quinol oxidase subunit 2